MLGKMLKVSHIILNLHLHIYHFEKETCNIKHAFKTLLYLTDRAWAQKYLQNSVWRKLNEKQL